MAQVGMNSHMILLNFNQGSRKCVSFTYLKIAMSEPRRSLVSQGFLWSFESSYLYNSSENVPLLDNTGRYPWYRKISRSNNGRVDDRLVHRMLDADLEVILLDGNKQHLQCQIVDWCRCLLYQFPNLILMITFILVDSWTCYKSQYRSLKEKRRTFKSHICARWKFVTPKRLLELVPQGGTSDLYILFVSYVRIIDLRDEIVEFREDRHNRNCLWSVTMKSLKVPNISPFPPSCSLKNLCSNPNNGRDTSGVKQNLNTLSVAPDQGRMRKSYHIACIWSITSLAFALSCRNESTSWSSFSPPASKPGESWKMNCGLLLNENSSYTLWTPLYGIKVNDLMKEIGKDCTFEVGLICWWRDDKNWVRNDTDILPCCKQDPRLYCRPAWARSFYRHSPFR